MVGLDVRKFSKANDTDLNKKIELMIKIINRTDSYLNSANTKSTILLSLASALIVALSVNYTKIIELVKIETDRFFLSFLFTLILLLLIASVLYSLKGITPFIKPSARSNTFSFVDIAVNYENLEDYRRHFGKDSELDFLNQLIALNHNLSKALVSKYRRQITAITFIEAAAYVLCLSIYMIVLSNC
ncbi:hypothetical protein MUU46_18905 [Scandinavium sp. TWS1a]|uniref:hypothetical protein n=1 Tax=Scandinavium tedordense TaxID=2926521 RepID=UPI002166AC03|nr:hypothetical protein [Scandinavium tedordense]MCS2172359.1 hypothetical protein [Scandinavium tedordense]